jgi:hypothetical protein
MGEKINKILILVSSIICIVVSACVPTVQTIEVTRIVTATVAVTQPIQKLTTPSAPPVTMVTKKIAEGVYSDETTTPRPTSRVTFPQASFTPQPTDTPGPTPFIDMSSQDPEIVIVQYYTLLGLRLYKEAYQLFSTHEQKNQPLTDFVSGAEQSYKVIKVLKVIRYNDWIKQTHGNAVAGWDDVFYVKLFIIGYDLANFAPVNGIVEVYAGIVKENGEVKIEYLDNFNGRN